MTAILGIPAFLHIMRGCGPDRGQTDRRCTQEEHFTRNKHDVGFSGHVIDYCLQAAGLTANQLGLSASTISPCLNPSVCLEAHLAYAPYAPAGPGWLQVVPSEHVPVVEPEAVPAARAKQELHGQYRKQYVFTQHHISHAASAFYPSPYDKAAILTTSALAASCTFPTPSGCPIRRSPSSSDPRSTTMRRYRRPHGRPA